MRPSPALAEHVSGRHVDGFIEHAAGLHLGRTGTPRSRATCCPSCLAVGRHRRGPVPPRARFPG